LKLFPGDGRTHPRNAVGFGEQALDPGDRRRFRLDALGKGFSVLEIIWQVERSGTGWSRLSTRC